MTRKRVSVQMDLDQYRTFKGACMIYKVPLVDALSYGAFLALKEMENGWRPEKRVRDMATGMEELP